LSKLCISSRGWASSAGLQTFSVFRFGDSCVLGDDIYGGGIVELIYDPLSIREIGFEILCVWCVITNFFLLVCDLFWFEKKK